MYSMTGNTPTRKKASAVFFAAIMVVSMVGVGFAGSAAAVADDGELNATDLDIADGVQSQSINFTAVNGSDFDDSGQGNPTITVSPVNSLTFNQVTNLEASRTSQGDVSGGAVTADASGTDLVVTIDENQLDTDAEDITIGVTMDVDAGSASVASSTYDLVSSAETDQTVNFNVTNSDNPSFAAQGDPSNIPIGQDSVTQTVTGVDVDLSEAGQDNVEVAYDISNLTDQGVGIDSVNPTVTDSTNVDGDFNEVNRNDDIIEFEFDAVDDENSVQFDFELTQIDTSGATTASPLNYSASAGSQSGSGDGLTNNFDIDPAAGSITGTVTDGNFSSPDGIENADVVAVDADGDVAGETTTGASGAYTISELSDGTYTLTANTSVYESDSIEVEVDGGDETSGADLSNLGPDIDVTPEEVQAGTTQTISGTSQIADDDRILYRLYNTSDTVVASGSTLSGDFSIQDFEFDETGTYTVEVESQDEGVNTTAEIVAGYEFQNVTFDPAEPTFEDDVRVSGTVLDGDGNEVSGVTVVVEDETGSDVESLSTDSNGFFQFTSSYDDAGVFNLTADDGTDIVYDSVSTDAQEADLTFEAEPDPTFRSQSTFTATLNDSEENPLAISDDGADVEGYLNVTGPFDEAPDTLEGESNITRAVSNGDGGTAYVHVVTDATGDDGVASFDASPITNNVNASLEVNTAAGGFDAGESNVSGLEDNSIFTPETPDYVAETQSIAVQDLGELNVNIGSDEVTVEEGTVDLGVTITGADGISVTDTDSTLDNATVTVDGPGVDEEFVFNKTNTPAVEVNPEEGGEITVTTSANTNSTVTGEDSVEVGPDEQAVDVDGELLSAVSPSSVTAGTNDNVSVVVTDLDENILVDRTITLTHEDAAEGFNNDGTLTDEIILESGDFSASEGAHVAENVTFRLPGTVSLEVEDGPTTTVDVAEAITIEGEDRYELRTDEELLASSTEDLNVTVYDLEDDAVENNTDTLDDVAGTLEVGEFFDAGAGDTATVTDVENGTVTAEDVTPDEVGSANLSATTDSSAFTAAGETTVREPDISTNLGENILTEGVTTEDVFIEVTDPRDGSTIGNADLQFAATNASFNVSGTADPITAGGDEDQTLSADGNITVDVTPAVLGEDPASLDLAVQVDDGYFGDTSIDAGTLQLAERENGQDVELREEIAFDSEEDITYVLRNANDARIDARDVNVTGANVDVQPTTDEGFFAINFANVDLAEGETITYNVSSDFGADNEITTDTVDVTQDLEEITLNASVADDSVVQGDDFDFTVVREDFSENTQATLTFVNSSGDEVISPTTGAIDTSEYGVVDTSDLEPGNYTVEVSKEDSIENGKTFLNDTVDVTVEEPPTSDIDVNVTDVNPAEPNTSATYNADVTFTNVENETAQFVSVDFGEQDVNLSNVDADSLGVNQPDGSNLDIANLYRGDSTEGLDNSTLVIELGDTIADANENDTYTVSVPDVDNGDAGDYTLTIGLHESGDEILGAAAPAFAADSDTYTIGEVEPAPTATVTFSDQTVENGSTNVTVDSANLSDGGFVAIHSTPVVNETQNITAVDSVVGVSEYLGNGTSENITVTLDEPLTENQTLVAMPHQDTNGNEVYDFVTSNGSADGAYTEDGAPVTDTASITVEADDVEGPGVITEGGEPAQDLDGDGTFEDIDGDGELTIFDVQALFDNRDDIASENVEFFDFDDNGEVDIFDVQQLFDQQQDA